MYNPRYSIPGSIRCRGYSDVYHLVPHPPVDQGDDSFFRQVGTGGRRLVGGATVPVRSVGVGDLVDATGNLVRRCEPEVTGLTPV